MGKTTRVGGGRAGGVASTRPNEEFPIRGDRIAIHDGAIEFGPGDGAAMDTRVERASSGRLSFGAGDLTVDDLTVSDDLTVTGAATVGDTLDVTGIATLFSYVGIGGSAGVTGALAVDGSTSGIWSPFDNGLLAASSDPAEASGTIQVTGGTIYLVKLPIPKAMTPTKLLWYVTTGATTATASENWVSVLSSAGAVLAEPVDVATASETSGLKTTTVAPGALTANTFVWGAILLQASTEATLAAAPATALTTLSNAGAATAALRYATNGTSQTTITTRTPASNTAGPAIWMGLDA